MDKAEEPPLGTISSSPNREMRPTSVRARSFLKAARKVFSTSATCLRSFISTKSMTTCPPDIAKTQLSGHFFSRLDIGLERHLTKAGFTTNLSGVDIHGRQGFGMVKSQMPPASHFATVRSICLRRLKRSHRAHPYRCCLTMPGRRGYTRVAISATRPAVSGSIHPDFAYIVRKIIVNGPMNNEFLINQARIFSGGTALTHVLSMPR